MRAVHEDAVQSHAEIRDLNQATRVQTNQERQQRLAMDDLGLEDGDDAVQYAMMLSMERDGHTPDGEEVDPEAAEAVRAVEAFQRAEVDEMSRILEAIRLAEERGE